MPVESGKEYPIRQNWSNANNTTDSKPAACAILASFNHEVDESLMPTK
jgi:hypothetical protein